MKKLLLLLAVFFAPPYTLIGQIPAFQFTHKGSLLHLKFSPDGSKLLSYSSGNQDMAMWDVQKERLLWKRPISFIQKNDEYYTLNAFAWSPDGKLVATGSGNGTVQLWDAQTGAFIWLTDVAKKGIAAVAYSPDGKVVAAVPYSDEKNAAVLLNAFTGEVLKTFEASQCTQIGLAFDENERELKIGNLDGNVGTWDLVSGKPIHEPACRTMISYAGERSFSEDLSLSLRRTNADEAVIEESTGKIITAKKLNDSRMKAVINSKAQMAVIEEYGGYHLFNLADGTDRMLDDHANGSAIDISADGQLFAHSTDGYKTAIKVTDLSTGKVLLLDGHPSTIHAISYSPDYSLLAIAGNDGNAYLLDPVSRSERGVLEGNGLRLTALTFSLDGKSLFTGDENGVLRQWDLITGKLMKESKLNDRSDDIEKIEVARDGKSFLVLINQVALILDPDLTLRGYVSTPEEYSSTSGAMTYTSSSVPILSAAFGPTGSNLITGHPDGTIQTWNSVSGRQIRKMKVADAVMFVAMQSSKHVVMIGKTGKYAAFGLVDPLDLTVLRRSRNFDGSYLEKMFISPDGRFAAVTDISGDIMICDLRTMALKKVDKRLSGSDSVAFAKDGNTFFIGGDDQNLALYDTFKGAKLWQLIPDFAPGPAEIKLAAERKIRNDALAKVRAERNERAAAYVKKFRSKVFVTFEHFGNMSDPDEKRIVESNDLKESKIKKTPAESNAVWLRLHNDSTLPIEVPAESMYFPLSKCFHQFPNGEKMYGLCKDREIGVWFGVKDTHGKWIPYGFDFGSSVILLPNSSVVFPVPLSIWRKNYFVVFDYSFQNLRAGENDREMDYGKKIELKISKQNLRKQ